MSKAYWGRLALEQNSALKMDPAQESVLIGGKRSKKYKEKELCFVEGN